MLHLLQISVNYDHKKFYSTGPSLDADRKIIVEALRIRPLCPIGNDSTSHILLRLTEGQFHYFSQTFGGRRHKQKSS